MTSSENHREKKHFKGTNSIFVKLGNRKFMNSKLNGRVFKSSGGHQNSEIQVDGRNESNRSQRDVAATVPRNHQQEFSRSVAPFLDLVWTRLSLNGFQVLAKRQRKVVPRGIQSSKYQKQQPKHISKSEGIIFLGKHIIG